MAPLFRASWRRLTIRTAPLAIVIVFFASECRVAVAAGVGSMKGVILKITDSGGDSGNVIPNPLTTNPTSVVNKLNQEKVVEVRVQVNEGANFNAVTTTGANAVNTLAALGYGGQVTLDHKKWYLFLGDRQDGWVDHIYGTYQKMNSAGKSLVGGYSFGETTPSDLDWSLYSSGVIATVNKLQARFLADNDPTNDEALAGMRIYVGGVGYGGSFKLLTPAQHNSMKNAIEGVGATMVYAYKSFHSLQGLPQPGPNDEVDVAAAMNWLNNEVGLANLAAVAGDTQVQYRADARDRIMSSAIRRQALTNIFNQHDNFLHVGAEKIIHANVDQNPPQAGQDLFEDNGVVRPAEWNNLNAFFDGIKQAPDVRLARPTSSTLSFNITHNPTNLPWFTTGGPTGYSGSITSGGGASSLVGRERVTIVGTATEAGNYSDGNGVPEGVAIAFDVSFEVSTSTGTLVDGGDFGLGVDSGSGVANGIDGNEQLHFSQIALSNVVVRDPRNLIVDDSESIGATWSVLRSADFDESLVGAIASSDAAGLDNVTAFGTAGPNAIDNNWTAGTLDHALSEMYLTTTGGNWRLKGIAYSIDLNFDLRVDDSADFNQDGIVDGHDFLVWQRGVASGTTFGEGDANHDKSVDASDLAVWQGLLNNQAVSGAASSVPEPGSASLAGVLLSFLAVQFGFFRKQGHE